MLDAAAAAAAVVGWEHRAWWWGRRRMSGAYVRSVVTAVGFIPFHFGPVPRPTQAYECVGGDKNATGRSKRTAKIRGGTGRKLIQNSVACR